MVGWKSLLMALSVVAGIGPTAALAATLTGGQLTANDPSGAFIFDPNPFSVGQVTTARVTDAFAWEFSLSEDGLFTATNVGLTINIPQGQPAFTFTDTTGSLPDFIGFTLISVTGVSDFTQDNLGFTADSLSFLLSRPSSIETRWEEGAQVTARVEVIPLPATLPLVLAALGGLGLLAQWRRVG